MKAGIAGLEKALNLIVDAINGRCPLEGDGIRIEYGPTGAIISRAKDSIGDSSGGGKSQSGATSTGNQAWLTTPNGETAGWQTIQVLDTSTSPPTVYDKYVWGGSNINPRGCS